MDKQALIEELKLIISDYLVSHGLELVDLIYRREGRDMVLRLLIDKPEGGITLDECAYINGHIGQILDNKNIIGQRYILEVSSPGLDRPLQAKKDFLRCINKPVRVFLTEPVNEKIEWEGRIIKVEGDSLFIDSAGMSIELPLEKVRKAKQVI